MKPSLLLVSLAYGLIASAQNPTPPTPPATDVAEIPDNTELAELNAEDQRDRRPAADGGMIDGRQLSERDARRRARVLEIYAADQIRTGRDYHHAALILQHGGAAEHYLLAHEFCVAALALGEKRAAWLAAASQDRFLRSIGRKQRFGTQFAPRIPGGRMQLGEIEEGVRDSLRAAMRVPSLERAKAREKEMTARFRADTTLRIQQVGWRSAEDAAKAGAVLLDPAAGDSLPEVLTQTKVPVPEGLADEAFAMISFAVEPDGRPANVYLSHSTDPAYGEATRTTVANWTFKPGVKNGQPVRAMVYVQLYHFPPDVPAAAQTAP